MNTKLKPKQFTADYIQKYVDKISDQYLFSGIGNCEQHIRK